MSSSSSSTTSPKEVSLLGHYGVSLGVVSRDQSIIETSIALSYDNPQWTDLTIICGNRRWECHRLVVCTQSKFLYDACKDGSAEDLAALVDLSDEDPDDVERLLKSMYTGKIEYKAEDPKRSLSDYEEKASADAASTEEPSQTKSPSVLDNKLQFSQFPNRAPTSDFMERTFCSLMGDHFNPRIVGVPTCCKAPYPRPQLWNGRHMMFTTMRTYFLAIKLRLPDVTKFIASREFCQTLLDPYQVDFPLVLDTFYSRLASAGETQDMNELMTTRQCLAKEVVNILCGPDTHVPRQIAGFKKAVMDVIKAHKILSEDVIEAQSDSLIRMQSHLEDLNDVIKCQSIADKHKRCASTQTQLPAGIVPIPGPSLPTTSQRVNPNSSGAEPCTLPALTLPALVTPGMLQRPTGQRKGSDGPGKPGLAIRPREC